MHKTFSNLKGFKFYKFESCCYDTSYISSDGFCDDYNFGCGSSYHDGDGYGEGFVGNFRDSFGGGALLLEIFVFEDEEE